MKIKIIQIRNEKRKTIKKVKLAILDKGYKDFLIFHYGCVRGTDERDKLKVTDILNNVMGKNEKKKI